MWLHITCSLIIAASDVRGVDTVPLKLARQHQHFEWYESPIVVGGTSGSGTRGVVDVLSKMGFYMHPPAASMVFKECYTSSECTG